MRKEWREFLAKIKPPLTFMHRDEFRKEFKLEDDLPAIYIQDLRTEELRPFIAAATLKTLTGLENLKQMISDKLTLEGLL